MSHIKTVSFGNFPVSFQNNGYLNATVVAAHFNRRVGNYLKSERTQEYISALAEKLSVTPKRATEDNQIVIIKQGGTEQGTWLHPKLAVDFARWLDPKFAVWCDEQIEQILSGSPKLETQTTIDERRGLVDAVKLLVSRCGIDYSAAYRMVHQRFGVAHIDQIAAPLLPSAVAYVHSLMLHNGISGEVLDRLPENLQPKPLRNLQGAVINSLYCAEFIYQHRLALRGLNRRLAATLNDHAADSIMFLRNVAEQAGIKVPDNEYFQYFPWDGDSAEKASYHQLNA
ncbi:KilA-N domain-containing protein [Eikenella sp. NML120348]|uniref:KilA-N domain-containing protein n=1 Tax=Eikenella sp. NML120348 TaxID=1795831 RepID=UPI0007DEB3F7|nr:KilA-N domain-containing protein [Eikenella sp. NML120348]OAM37828.1 hypothetical protein A7P99_05465 [Eikenella sp. NML120348]